MKTLTIIILLGISNLAWANPHITFRLDKWFGDNFTFELDDTQYGFDTPEGLRDLAVDDVLSLEQVFSIIIEIDVELNGKLATQTLEEALLDRDENILKHGQDEEGTSLQDAVWRHLRIRFSKEGSGTKFHDGDLEDWVLGMGES